MKTDHQVVDHFAVISKMVDLGSLRTGEQP